MLLDDMTNKGYGISSAINMFIATNVCENIIWNTFSPLTYKTANSTEYYGSVIGNFNYISSFPFSLYLRRQNGCILKCFL